MHALPLLEKNNSDPIAEIGAASFILKRAVAGGHEGVVRAMISAGANIREADDEALRIACAGGKTAIVQLLLEQGCSPRALGGEPLRAASAGGHLSTVELLLKKGADGRDPSALALAALGGYKAVVSCLIDEGADPTSHDWYAARMAADGGHASLLPLLLKGHTSFPPDALRRAAARGRSSVIAVLAKKGDIAEPDALIEAAKNGHVQAGRLIIKNIPVEKCIEPLLLACRAGPTAFITLLSEHARKNGAERDWIGAGGRTLMEAAKRGKIGVVKALYNAGVSLENGSAAADAAAESGFSATEAFIRQRLSERVCRKLSTENECCIAYEPIAPGVEYSKCFVIDAHVWEFSRTHQIKTCPLCREAVDPTVYVNR